MTVDLLGPLEHWGSATVLATGGGVVGLLFGLLAQRSGFCLRFAVIEFWRGRPGDRLAVWLLSFSAAVVAVQALEWLQWVDLGNARQLSARGSLSGALIGGLAFGAGMILARGCASRLLILAASGNLRALLSGLIFAVTAQAALAGALSPLRETIFGWWTVEGGPARSLLAQAHLGHGGGLLVGLVWLAAALWYAVRSRKVAWKWLGGLGAGVAVALAWAFTGAVAANSFDVVPIEGLTFSGPSAEWLMRVVTRPGPAIGFTFGMLPGVFLGACVGALLGGNWKLEGFRDGYSMRRYIVGAMLMGFGAMLAGGCAVGAGISGGAVFSLTAWVALVGMWLGGGLADRLVDREPSPTTVAP